MALTCPVDFDTVTHVEVRDRRRAVHIVARFDCFAETTKERTARRSGVGGVNLGGNSHVTKGPCKVRR
jgi:hypothetical protein